MSVASDGAQSNDASWDGFDISDDGRFVAFASEASNLELGDGNGSHDVFVHSQTDTLPEQSAIVGWGPMRFDSSWNPDTFTRIAASEWRTLAPAPTARCPPADSAPPECSTSRRFPAG